MSLIVSHPAADYQTALVKLLPSGRVWPGTVYSVQGQVMGAVAETFARSDARAVNLLVDAFPLTTNELLPEWEIALGLPDPCVGELPTIAQRVDAVVVKFLADGGQSIAYFQKVAAQQGVEITISEFRAMRAGFSSGDPVNGSDFAFHFVVNAAASQLVYYFSAGTSQAGDPVESFQSSGLECLIRRLMPAHTTVAFTYGIDLTTEDGRLILTEDGSNLAIGSTS